MGLFDSLYSQFPDQDRDLVRMLLFTSLGQGLTSMADMNYPGGINPGGLGAGLSNAAQMILELREQRRKEQYDREQDKLRQSQWEAGHKLDVEGLGLRKQETLADIALAKEAAKAKAEKEAAAQAALERTRQDVRDMAVFRKENPDLVDDQDIVGLRQYLNRKEPTPPRPLRPQRPRVYRDADGLYRYEDGTPLTGFHADDPASEDPMITPDKALNMVRESTTESLVASGLLPPGEYEGKIRGEDFSLEVQRQLVDKVLEAFAPPAPTPPPGPVTRRGGAPNPTDPPELGQLKQEAITWKPGYGVDWVTRVYHDLRRAGRSPQEAATEIRIKYQEIMGGY